MSNEPLPKETITLTITTDKNWNGSVQGQPQPLSISYSFLNGIPPYYFDPDKVTFQANNFAWEFVNLYVDKTNPANFSSFNPGQKNNGVRSFIVRDQSFLFWKNAQ